MCNPFDHIQKSIHVAQQSADRNAGLLFLATASEDGQPSIRTLLLRKIKGRSLLILFSTHHGKWRNLQVNQLYEVLLWYPFIGHQYRIQGSFSIAERSELIACWNEQPTLIKRVDMSYGGAFIPGHPCDNMADFRNEVEKVVEEEAKLAPPPEHVVAAWLTATHVEKMVESPDRLHDRTQYIWHDETWHAQTLVP